MLSYSKNFQFDLHNILAPLLPIEHVPVYININIIT